MSMELLTLLQLLYVIAIYIGVVVLIPAAVFHGKFEDHPFYVRYTAYACIGNFYLMNLVFLLQLLHISNRATLILGVIIPAMIATAVYHWRDWVKASLVSAGETTHNVIVNTMGVKLFLARIFQNLGQALMNMLKAIAENLLARWFDWIGTIAVIVIICWQYGTNLFSTYGYTASDMMVHNYWINAMGENKIFVAGVYPFGFHCIIYFFHAVFGIETFVMLRLFSLLETFMIHLALLFLLRLLCKTESASYVAIGFYLLLNIWGKSSYVRYFSALPQEYGMIFILPSIFFLILFFRERAEENGEKGLRGNRSTTMLKMFAINVSMTLAVHFYDTIALGIFCVAIAIAFGRLVFRKDFFGRIILAGTLGLVIAIFPMWFAYLGGTPLEGSLRWGMSVMNGNTGDNEEEFLFPDQSMNVPENEEIAARTTAALADAPGAVEDAADAGMISVGKTDNAKAGLELAGIGTAATAQNITVPGYLLTGTAQEVVSTEKISFFTRMTRLLSGYVYIGKGSIFGLVTIILIFIGFAFAALAHWRRETESGRALLAVSLNVLFFCILFMAKELGIPTLMDKNRCSVYIGYFVIILWGLIIDRSLDVGMGLIDDETLKKVFPGIFAVVCFGILGLLGWVRVPAHVEAFQKNGAIICVENILRENKPGTFSIISANDEMRMVEDYGYHFEVSKLLIQNMGDNANNYLQVPSSRVYVFIEKIPGDYDEPYEGSGRPISRDSARRPLPYLEGFNMYKGANRHIVMSKLYFWAQAFGKMYENEMSTYYEDDEFVCYEIKQNVDRPFDMSFNYGFNN